MRAVRLLEHAISKEPKTVLDVGVGKAQHAHCFLAQGCSVTGLDPAPPQLEHPNYEHIHSGYEIAGLGDRQFDMVWCSHTLEHIPNIQHFLIHLRKWVKPGGWLFIAVPSSRQNRFHVGHCTLWTPAHLVYNLVCAGWDCKDANWYTEYLSIGLCVQRVDDIDMSGRTALPSEVFWLNEYSPIRIYHEDGAWWGNNWHEEVEASRVPDPPFCTIGYERSNLPPEVQLSYGPNPALRKPAGASINNCPSEG
jgi:SAM-dependent methyltransferase